MAIEASYKIKNRCQEIIHKNKLLNLKSTIRNKHFPESNGLLDRANYRLKFEELFYIESLIALKKQNNKKQTNEHNHINKERTNERKDTKNKDIDTLIITDSKTKKNERNQWRKKRGKNLNLFM